MCDEIVSVEVSKLSVTYRSYQADKPLQRLRSCFVLGPVELHSRLLLSMAFGIYILYSQLEYKVHYKIQPYIFRSTNYEYQNILSFLSTINSD